MSLEKNNGKKKYFTNFVSQYPKDQIQCGLRHMNKNIDEEKNKDRAAKPDQNNHSVKK